MLCSYDLITTLTDSLAKYTEHNMTLLPHEGGLRRYLS